MNFHFKKPNRKVTRVFLHCSASDNPAHDNVATIDAWHKQNGWAGIGYHFFIRWGGALEDGRNLELTPAAQAGNNAGTIAICLHGLKVANFTQNQFETLRALCHQINDAYGGKVTFHGHCEVAAKTCPVFDYRKILGLTSTGLLPLQRSEKFPSINKYTVDGLDQLEKPEFRAELRPAPTLKLDASGAPVKWLQQELTKLGYFTGALDGQFGKRTRAAVLAFQADNDLVADGIFGPASREALRSAKPREVLLSRQTANANDLVSQGSRIVQSSLSSGATGLLFAGGGALTIVQETTGVVTQLTDSMGVFGVALERFGPWIGLAVLVGGGFIFWQSMRSVRARIDDHRKGRTA